MSIATPPANANSAISGPSVTDPVTPGPPDRSLKQLAIRGTLFLLVGNVGQQILRLASSLILTRLLVPEAFGLMALVGAMMAALQMFSDVGITPSIIQNKRGEDVGFLDTAWTIQVVRGFLLWGVACSIAYPLALVYEESMLLLLLPVAGFSTVLTGFQSTKVILLNRRLAVGQAVMLNMFTQVVRFVVMLAVAWVWPTVWALVIGLLAAQLARTIASFLMPGRNNRFRWDREASGEMFRFGKWVFVSTVCAFLARQTETILLPKLVPLAVFGVYTIAMTWVLPATETLLRVGDNVVFPVYSRIVNSGRSLGEVLERVRRPVSVSGGFAMTMMMMVAVALIEFLYDQRYIEAGPMLQIMAVGGWFQILSGTYNSAQLAMGRSGAVAVGHGVKFIGMAIMIPVGFYYVGGIEGAIYGVVLSEFLRYVFVVAMLPVRGTASVVSDMVLTGLIVLASVLGVSAGVTASNAGLGSRGTLAVELFVAAMVWMVPLVMVARQVLSSRALAVPAGTVVEKKEA